MTPFQSLLAIPLATLSACGGDSPANGISVWDCHLSLTAPDDEALRRTLSHGTGISIFEDRRESPVVNWTAHGHLDGRMHVAADDPFPVKLSGDANRPVLVWDIHELRVRATVAWASEQRTEGEMHLVAFVPEDARHERMWGNNPSFTMRGNCERDRQSEATLNKVKRT